MSRCVETCKTVRRIGKVHYLILATKWRRNTPIPRQRNGVFCCEPMSKQIGFVATLISCKDPLLKFHDNAVFLSSPLLLIYSCLISEQVDLSCKDFGFYYEGSKLESQPEHGMSRVSWFSSVHTGKYTDSSSIRLRILCKHISQQSYRISSLYGSKY